VQQPLAELGLQAPDLLADGGLADPHPVPRRGSSGPPRRPQRSTPVAAVP